MGAAKVYKPILDYLHLPDGHEVYAALILGFSIEGSELAAILGFGICCIILQMHCI